MYEEESPSEEEIAKRQRYKKEMNQKVSLLIARQKFPFTIKINPQNKNYEEGDEEHNNIQELLSFQLEFDTKEELQQFVAIISKVPGYVYREAWGKSRLKSYSNLSPVIIEAYFKANPILDNELPAEPVAKPVVAAEAAKVAPTDAPAPVVGVEDEEQPSPKPEDNASDVAIHEKLQQLTENYLRYLSTFEYALVAKKFEEVKKLVICLANEDVSKKQSVIGFYAQLDDSEGTLKEHRNPSWKRFVKAALIVGGILLSGILPGLAALAVYMTSNKKELGSLRFWKSEGKQLVDKLKEPNVNKDELPTP